MNKIIRGKNSWFPIAIPLLIARVINLKQLVAGEVFKILPGKRSQSEHKIKSEKVGTDIQQKYA